MDENEDTPPITFDYVMGWVINFFAALGITAFAACIGLYYAGFFHWLAEQAGRSV